MDYPSSERGKCTTCGFAAKRALAGAEVHYNEIGKAERETALGSFSITVPVTGMVANKQGQAGLACLRGVIDFNVLIQQECATSGEKIDAVRDRVFRAQAGCQHWDGYRPGLFPKDHLTLYYMEELAKDTRRFQKAVLRANRRSERRFRRLSVFLIVLSIVVAILFSIVNLMHESTTDKFFKWLMGE